MAYSTVPTVSVGYQWLASDNNTYIKDNFAAGVPDIFTTAGDIAVATGSAAADRVGTGVAVLSVLLAASAETTGVKYATNGSGNARYGRATTQTISNTTETIVDFATASYDFLGLVTTGAAWKFTAPAPGYYFVSCNISFQSSANWAAGEYIRMSLFKNGVAQQFMNILMMSATGTYATHITGQQFVYLPNTTDYIDVRIYQNSGGDLVINNDATQSHIGIFRTF